MDKTQLAYNRFISFGVTALLGFAIFSVVRALKPFQGGPKSPVRVVGGSITFRAKDKWKKTKGQGNCDHSSPTSNDVDNCTYTTNNPLDTTEVTVVNGDSVPPIKITDKLTIDLYPLEN